MIKYFYPDNVLKFIFITFLSLLFCTPILIFEDKISPSFFPIIIFVGLFIFYLLLYYIGCNKTDRIFFYKSEYNLTLSLRDIIMVVLFALLSSGIMFVYNTLRGNSVGVVIEHSLIFVNITIIAPIVEETIFRGIFLKSLLTKYSKRKSLIISSLAFAIIHIYPLQILMAFVYGLIFGGNYIKKRSLTNVIILHSIANIIGVLVTNYFFK